MTHKTLLAATALVAAAAVTIFTTPTFAQEHETTHSRKGEHPALSEAQHQKIEERKAAIQERITATKTTASEKLAAKRLEICEKRQANINTIITRGTAQNAKQLAVIQKIEAKVLKFAEEKSITSDAVVAAATAADEKEATAIAAIEASQETTFDCATADGKNPGSVIKQAMTSRHAALKEYRTAVKELIVAVKQANNETASSGEDATTNTTEEQ